MAHARFGGTGLVARRGSNPKKTRKATLEGSNLRSVVFRLSGVIGAGLLACMLSRDAGASTEGSTEAPAATPTAIEATAPTPAEIVAGAPAGAFASFLDRLMRAESNGRDTAANPRSTALGPFQFIKSTFLDVMRRHFSGDIADLNETDILALRTDRAFARRAAEAFSKENLDYLAVRGLKPTFGHLRLAFLLGPVGAARVMEAPSAKPVTQILDDKVIAANPFMRGMRAVDLIARAHRDVGAELPASQVADAAAASPQAAPQVAPEATPEPATATPARSEPGRPQARKIAGRPATRTTRPAAAARSERSRTPSRTAVINVKCNPKLASCQRWIELQVARLAKVADRAETPSRRDRGGA
jgi:hypothetical protein